MSSYAYDTSHDAACFTPGREGRAIDHIIIHHWDDPANHPTYEGTISWFENPTSQVSAHYVVEAGRVACLVNEPDTAWHAGTWDMNLRSIGIECNPRCSDEDKATVAELVSELLSRYPGAVILGHKDVVPTDCPGNYYAPKDTLAPWLNPAKPAASPAAPSESVDELAHKVINGEFGNGEARRAALGSLYDAVQARVNEILSGSAPAPAPKPDIDAMARAVINGEYGNGQERKDRLGSLYDAVQARVNEMLS